MLKLRVKEVAQAKGINDPVALASKADIAYATAYRLWLSQVGAESRGVGIHVLYKVARALGVSIADLLEEAAEEAPGKFWLVPASA